MRTKNLLVGFAHLRYAAGMLRKGGLGRVIRTKSKWVSVRSHEGKEKEVHISHEVVAALIIQSQKILLGQRSATRAFYPNVWDVFGGHVEPGEQHQQTLVRELREELGITPTLWTYLETLTLSLPASPNEPFDQLTVHLYLVTAWAGIIINRQPEEHSTIGWFSLAQAVVLDLAHPSYPRLFAQYLGPD